MIKIPGKNSLRCLSVAGLAGLFLLGQHVLAARGPVLVRNGTVMTDRAHPIQACHLWLGITADRTKKTMTESTWLAVSAKYKLNAVRLLLSRSWGDIIPDDQIIPMIDRCVEYAAKANIYVILDYHDIMNRGELTDAEILGFWKKVAPRYKDKPHVIYEFLNEPVGDRALPVFQANAYKLIRSLAPKTHVILFSWASNAPRIERIEEILTMGVSFSNASVSFHYYGGVTTAKIQTCMKRAPIICTEFTSNVSKIAECEKLKIAWCAWGYPDGDSWSGAKWALEGIGTVDSKSPKIQPITSTYSTAPNFNLLGQHSRGQSRVPSIHIVNIEKNGARTVLKPSRRSTIE